MGLNFPKPTVGTKVLGYLPDDMPPFAAMLSLGFQQVLTMFPATVLVAILTKFDIGMTLLASGIGTIIALLVSKGRIPLYYGSSFSYIAVVSIIMNTYDNACFNDPAVKYCGNGVALAQVGIIGTALIEVLAGFLITWVGKKSLDKVLPPIITGSVAIVIGISLAGAALNMAGANWAVAFITLFFTVVFSVYLQGKGLLGMLPILLGALAGYATALIFDAAHLSGETPLVGFTAVADAQWVQVPRWTVPNFFHPDAFSIMLSVGLIAIATIPESTAHLYQMSLYIDQLAKDMKREPKSIKDLIGLNLIADGCDDFIQGLLGGCAGTNYGENNSLMAITRNYSVWVLGTAGIIAVVLGFIGKLSALVGTIPTAVTGGLAIYLFGVIGKQGVALIQSEKVNLFDPRNLAVGAIILVLGIGGNMGLPNGTFPFIIPTLFPQGIPAIVFAALVGILLNLVFVLLPPEKFGVVQRTGLD